ncbi:MAG: ATP-binding protein [Candidatus Omnitrophica bacterium]|nr:ATP-binding protein [Candidatus Omnitrophota bacterium]
MEILGHYLFLSICGYLTGILCIALALLVLLANPKSKNCQLTFLLNLSVAVWSIFYATMYFTKDDFFGISASKTLTTGTIYLSTFFTHLVLVLVKKEKAQKNLLFLNYASAGILTLTMVFTQLVIEGSPPKLDFSSYTEGGPLYSLIPLYLLLNVLYSVAVLTRGIKENKGYRKNQLILFLAAAIIGYAAGAPAFLLVFDIPVKPITTPLVSLYPIILTYAIAKHRFLDIQKLVKNTLIFSLLFILLLGFMAAILIILKEVISRWVGVSEALAQGLALALAIGLYGPLKNGLSRLTNRLLHQQAYHPETIFGKLSAEIIHILEPKKLAREVTDRIAEILSLDRIGFYLRSHRAPQFFELQAMVGRLRKTQIHPSKQLIRYLDETHDILVNSQTQRESRNLSKRHRFFALADLKEIRRQATIELAGIGGVAAFPVFVQNSLHAVLVIGRKKSDAPWRDEEFHILKSFMRHLSLVLGNAEYAEEIRRSREKISTSERDASAGSLIAGVEHEVKNPLAAMTLNIGALRTNLADPRFLTGPREVFRQETAEILKLTRQYVEKIGHIIDHLSDLAHSKPLAIVEGVRPNLVVDKVISMFRENDAWDKIRIHNRISPSLTLAGDPDAILEILSNLIRNAQQAISGEGEIILEEDTAGQKVVIRVRDTGTGIPPEQLSKIFEPFYTTKRKKQGARFTGSGMGLFIVKQLMQGMGGDVEVQSEVGQGSVFNLHFPNLESPAGRAA